jgi:hypothetical protein
MPPTPSPTQCELRQLIARLRAEIAQHAETGDTLACDIRHGWIESVELTMALLTGEREAELF